MRRLLIALTASVVLAACTASPAPTHVEATPSVGVQLFQWPWRSVAAECTEVLGPGEFAFVVLSPAQEHITGEAWWTSYQPVSYQIDSKLGTRKEFQQMVQTCHDAGVQVYADAVINHMSGVDSGTGFAGTVFAHYDYPGLYTEADFHHCAAVNSDISDYQDREQVQTCEMSNLADLRTDLPEVRAKIRAYLDDLLSLGVDGFRIDAAKHIPAEDVADVVADLDGDPTIISEVIRGSGEPIQPEEYLEFGDAYAFQVARDLTGLVRGGSVRRVLELSDGSVPSDQAYTFVTNHDTERNGQTLTYRDGADYRLATVLLLGMGYGTPVVYSGYAFSGRDEGPDTTDGRVNDVVCADDTQDEAWLCQHREVLGMVGWRAVVGDAAVEHLVSDGQNVAFDRGDRGLLAVNAASEPWTVTLATNLPDGSYCDAVTLGECQASDAVEVEGGSVTLTVPPEGAVALHVNRRL